MQKPLKTSRLLGFFHFCAYLYPPGTQAHLPCTRKWHNSRRVNLLSMLFQAGLQCSARSPPRQNFPRSRHLQLCITRRLSTTHCSTPCVSFRRKDQYHLQLTPLTMCAEIRIKKNPARVQVTSETRSFDNTPLALIATGTLAFTRLPDRRSDLTSVLTNRKPNRRPGSAVTSSAAVDVAFELDLRFIFLDRTTQIKTKGRTRVSGPHWDWDPHRPSALRARAAVASTRACSMVGALLGVQFHLPILQACRDRRALVVP